MTTRCCWLGLLLLLVLPAYAQLDMNMPDVDGYVVVQDGVALAPVFQLAIFLGVNVSYDAATDELALTRQPVTLAMKLGSDVAVVNGRTIRLAKPPALAGKTTVFSRGMLLVPVRPLAEAFAAAIDWDSKTSLLTLTRPDNKHKLVLLDVESIVKRRAMETVCVNNLRQIAIGMLMFCQDNDEVFPDADTVWKVVPANYGLDLKILVCPLRPDLPLGYGYNTKLSKMALGDIKDPANTILAAESTKPLIKSVDDLDARHDGFCMVAFVDGHIAKIKPKDAKLVWK